MLGLVHKIILLWKLGLFMKTKSIQDYCCLHVFWKVNLKLIYALAEEARYSRLYNLRAG